MYCKPCKKNINVGNGGMKNFAIHEKSKEHRKSAGESPSGFLQMRNYFSKPSAPQASKANPKLSNLAIPGPSTSNPQEETGPLSALQSSLASTPWPEKSTLEEARSLKRLRTDLSAGQQHAITLVSELCAAARSLPNNVSEGAPNGLFAGFRYSPAPDPDDDDEPMIYFNKALHSALGWNESPEQLSKKITRGPLGIEALCG